MAPNSAASVHPLVEVVRRSPELANQHDREGWLGLYTADAVVEDPVGTPAARRGVVSRKGKDDLERFYETFIAPSRIRVEELGDVVVDGTVVRDVVLHVVLPGGGKAQVPAVLRYDLVDLDGAPKVKHLRAYWDAGRNGRAMLAQGFRGQVTSILSGIRLLRVLGRDWAKRYLDGTKRGIRRDGAPKVEAFAKAFAEGDRAGLASLVAEGATLHLPGRPATRIVDADGKALGLALTRATSSGFAVTARCRANDAGRVVSGMAFVEFDPGSKAITKVELFWNAA